MRDEHSVLCGKLAGIRHDSRKFRGFPHDLGKTWPWRVRWWNQPDVTVILSHVAMRDDPSAPCGQFINLGDFDMNSVRLGGFHNLGKAWSERVGWRNQSNETVA